MSRMIPDDEARQDSPLVVPDQASQLPETEEPNHAESAEAAPETRPGQAKQAAAPQAEQAGEGRASNGQASGATRPAPGQQPEDQADGAVHREVVGQVEAPEQTAEQAIRVDSYIASTDEDKRHRPPRSLGRRRRSRGRVRRFARRPTVRVIGALFGIFLIWVCFSMGQALTAPGGGSTSERLAEWARDHYLGPVVTFGEWLTYQPPKSGGNPSFSLTVPRGENAAAIAAAKAKAKKDAFTPIIPAPLSSLAGKPLAGEGQWRVLEAVKGEPAIFGTFLRQSATYSSYVSGIVSMDQRLVTFQLHPGSEDPGGGGWGPNAASWIPPGARSGLLATFNGGFKLDVSQGGFYLNGHTHGSLVNGAASIVYYKDGAVKIGSWGSEVQMSSQVVGVRQNLKLIVDNGQVPSSVDSNVETSWGATLGGGYYVWRSGLGITKDGRIIYVYGPALNVRQLATLLQHAGAVEAMQLDINPDWMAYDYYQADGKPSDPTPVALLPDQPTSTQRYYSVWSRDFTAVYAR